MPMDAAIFIAEARPVEGSRRPRREDPRIGPCLGHSAVIAVTCRNPLWTQWTFRCRTLTIARATPR